MRDIDHFLLAAVQQGDLEQTTRWIRSGADVNANSPVGSPGAYTPLMLAALFGQAEIAALLLEHGADPSAETPSEPGVATRTVLLVAVANARVEVVELLLRHGAAVNATNDLGETALSVAKRREFRPDHPGRIRLIIALLRQAGARE